MADLGVMRMANSGGDNGSATGLSLTNYDDEQNLKVEQHLEDYEHLVDPVVAHNEDADDDNRLEMTASSVDDSGADPASVNVVSLKEEPPEAEVQQVDSSDLATLPSIVLDTCGDDDQEGSVNRAGKNEQDDEQVDLAHEFAQEAHLSGISMLHLQPSDGAQMFGGSNGGDFVPICANEDEQPRSGRRESCIMLENILINEQFQHQPQSEQQPQVHHQCPSNDLQYANQVGNVYPQHDNHHHHHRHHHHLHNHHQEQQQQQQTQQELDYYGELVPSRQCAISECDPITHPQQYSHHHAYSGYVWPAEFGSGSYAASPGTYWTGLSKGVDDFSDDRMAPRDSTYVHNNHHHHLHNHHRHHFYQAAATAEAPESYEVVASDPEVVDYGGLEFEARDSSGRCGQQYALQADSGGFELTVGADPYLSDLQPHQQQQGHLRHQQQVTAAYYSQSDYGHLQREAGERSYALELDESGRTYAVLGQPREPTSYPSSEQHYSALNGGYYHGDPFASNADSQWVTRPPTGVAEGPPSVVAATAVPTVSGLYDPNNEINHLVGGTDSAPEEEEEEEEESGRATTSSLAESVQAPRARCRAKPAYVDATIERPARCKPETIEALRAHLQRRQRAAHYNAKGNVLSCGSSVSSRGSVNSNLKSPRLVYHGSSSKCSNTQGSEAVNVQSKLAESNQATGSHHAGSLFSTSPSTTSFSESFDAARFESVICDASARNQQTESPEGRQLRNRTIMIPAASSTCEEHHNHHHDHYRRYDHNHQCHQQSNLASSVSPSSSSSPSSPMSSSLVTPEHDSNWRGVETRASKRRRYNHQSIPSPVALTCDSQSHSLPR